jgi:hypothetical protein
MKKIFFGILNINEESSQIRSWIQSRIISQRYGSSDLDPHQNVTDPQNCHQQGRIIFGLSTSLVFPQLLGESVDLLSGRGRSTIQEITCRIVRKYPHQ